MIAVCLDVLILGDGNFSFSMAYKKRFPNDRVFATSFDSQSNLSQKYKEFNSLLPKLKAAGCVVMFEVDATNIEETLKSSFKKSEDESKTTMEAQEKKGWLFDLIIFNFPHLGVEDQVMHRFLLSHFLDSARERLLPTKPEAAIRLSLTLDQARNWELKKQVERTGLKILNSEDFREEDW
eukprot:CAMPEP_0167758462 /NCGR_PEP_ID=MMETSP0110_2-20121227/10481_1 /TAXON_ID=629695 /ORGANISM="Gymnochlora sp., Strain CCMP2014" /LENGTH=179 /DNA_ID=CAMNT_0007644739 /DNA_START=1 /DNA_END=537 /DNA_ORIENTATION=+